MPLASLAFPGTAGSRGPSGEATRVCGPRRPHCGAGTAARGLLLPALGARPPALLGAVQGPHEPLPRWVQHPRAVPILLPRGLGVAGARSGPPQGALAHRYLHPRRRRPPAPFPAGRPWSSFARLLRRRLRTWSEVGAPGLRSDAALAGPAPGGGGGGGGGGGRGARGTAGRVSFPARGPLRQPRAREKPSRTRSPRLALATEHAQCAPAGAGEELPPAGWALARSRRAEGAAGARGPRVLTAPRGRARRARARVGVGAAPQAGPLSGSKVGEMHARARGCGRCRCREGP